MVRLSCRSRTAIGEDFQEQLVDFIIARATRELLTPEQLQQALATQEASIMQQYRQEMGVMKQEIEELQALKRILLPSTADLLSNAGSSLNIGKKLKLIGNN